MTPERWQRLDRLFQSAVALPPTRRASYLRDACQGDTELRQEVESLIESHRQAGSFIEAPALPPDGAFDGETETEAPPASRMLAAGTRLGPYRIEAFLGAGGMGTVYRALDTRLGREVALKVLPDSFGADRAWRVRFEREARAVAALNHPNIVTLHSLEESGGLHFLTMELVRGRRLDRSFPPTGLAAEALLGCALSLSDALAAAHKRGIVHRDLKPGNVMLTHDGRLKLLDFGLATIAAGSGAFAPLDRAGELTGEGLVAGTCRYMSPEQVRRRPLDCRSDVFALGVVLYELAAGHSPFDRATPPETWAAILREQPAPVGALRPDLPPALTGLIMRCLEKDRRRRFADAGDFHRCLRSCGSAAPPAIDSPAAPSDRAAHRPASRALAASFLLGAAVLTAALAAAPSWLQPRDGSVPLLRGVAGLPALVRYDATAGGFAPFLDGVTASGLDTSPDGQWLAYTVSPERELWRARVDGSDRRRLTGPPLVAALPRWSPDGTRIAFAGKAPGRPWQIHVVAAEGGSMDVLPPEDVTDPGWTADGTGIVFGPASPVRGAIARWDLASRRQTLVPGSFGLFSPRPSPDGRYLAALDDSYRLRLLDLAAGEWSALGDGMATYPAWTRDGTWLHFRRDEPGDSSFRRIDPATHHDEPLTAVARLLCENEWGSWSGLSPAGEPLFVLPKGTRLSVVTAPPAVRPSLHQPSGAVVGLQGTFLFPSLRSHPRCMALLKRMNAG